MVYPSLLSLSLGLGLLLFFHGCFAQLLEQQHQQGQQQWRGMQGGQQHRLRAKTDCNIRSLSAQEPSRRIESDGGTTEIWDRSDHEQFECAGVSAIRHTLQPRGLLLPSYTNAPQLYYVIQGRGIQGTVIPGCPETYESGRGSQSEGQRSSRDRHQKIRQIREGDIIALPAGVAHWAFNNGDRPLVCVSLLDVGNDANQLDLNYRKFFLAGNPGRDQQSPGLREREQRRRGQQQNAGNVFSGIDEQLLADVFDVDRDTARRMQGQDDMRGNIVRVEKDFEVISPEYQGREEQERERGRRHNGLEETICSMRLRQNIGNPSRADVYNPRGGRVSTLNGHDLPILNSIQLSAERGVLYKNAIMAPHWNINAHSIIYIIRGSGRLQVVGNSGRSVFDDRVQEGQLMVVPQNFAVVKKASDEGLEWIAFKTDGNAMSSQVAGRVSAIRSMPEEVLMNSYGISREEARNLKFNRQEMTVFGPGSRSERDKA